MSNFLTNENLVDPKIVRFVGSSISLAQWFHRIDQFDVSNNISNQELLSNLIDISVYRFKSHFFETIPFRYLLEFVAHVFYFKFCFFLDHKLPSSSKSNLIIIKSLIVLFLKSWQDLRPLIHIIFHFFCYESLLLSFLYDHYVFLSFTLP